MLFCLDFFEPGKLEILLVAQIDPVLFCFYFFSRNVFLEISYPIFSLFFLGIFINRWRRRRRALLVCSRSVDFSIACQPVKNTRGINDPYVSLLLHLFIYLYIPHSHAHTNTCVCCVIALRLARNSNNSSTVRARWVTNAMTQAFRHELARPSLIRLYTVISIVDIVLYRSFIKSTLRCVSVYLTIRN